MTLIYNTSEFWIEEITGPQQTTGFGQYYAVDLSLAKGGRCLGWGSSLKVISDGSHFGPMVVLHTDGTVIEYGDEITAIRIRIQNLSTTTSYFIQPTVVVFMRR